MHWGNPDATSASSGKIVFSRSNGYVSVLHMGDAVEDAVGTVEPKDTGTTPVPGIIGKGRHLPGRKGINCGETIRGLPTGAGPYSTEAWSQKAQKRQ